MISVLLSPASYNVSKTLPHAADTVVLISDSQCMHYKCFCSIVSYVMKNF